MKEKCYTTLTKTTHKNRIKDIIGPCGPCSFINLIKAKGSFELEKKLSEIGRIKPFYLNDYTSFLIWGNKFKKEFKVFTSSKKITKKTFNLMIKYENTPIDKREEFVKTAKKIHEKRNKKFSNQIKFLKNPMEKLNKLLKQNYRIAVLISDFYSHKDNPIAHWIVCFKKEKNKYWFFDSNDGVISLSKNQLEKGWRINKKQGYCAQLIAYKNN
jgi:hypothetical protein